MKLLIPLEVLAASLLLFAGCASSGYEKAGKTSTSLQETAQGIDHSLILLNNVVVTLSDLVNNPQANLTPQFKKYSSAVAKLESLAEDVNDHAAAMREHGADYFQNWDKELAKMQNEDIHSRSLERKNEVTAQFEKVRISYAHTSTECAPFLIELKDIRTALATDLTAGGITSIKELADKANTQVVPVRESLLRLSTDFKNLGIALSSTTAAAK